MLPPDTGWQGPRIDDAIRQSRNLVTEVTGLDDKTAISQIFSKLALSKDLPPLEQRIPADLLDELQTVRKGANTPGAALNKLESWAAAIILANGINAELGLESAHGAEQILQDRFAAMGKPHSGLETAAQQFGLFDQLPEADQRLLLAAILRRANNARAQTQDMLQYWMQGNVEALLANPAQSALASPRLRESLLDARNANWARQLAVMIERGDRPFVAVGAAHVAGPGGLPALMAAKGYKVERIQ